MNDLPKKPELIFIADSHRYFLDGVEVPSVTQVLEPLVDYSHVPPAVMEHARQIGTAVHRACELYDQHDLVMESLDPRLVGYVNAWDRFLVECGFVNELIEPLVWSQVYGCAGRADRVGLARGVRGQPRVLLEIKTTADFMPSFGPQTAAYKHLLGETGLVTPAQAARLRRGVVQLREDGSYRLEFYDDPQDLSVFVACLTLNHWRKRYAK